MEFNVQDLFLRLEQRIDPADLDRLNEDEWQLLGKREDEAARIFAAFSLLICVSGLNPC